MSIRRQSDGKPPALAYAAWIAICVIWGTTYLGIRICLETMPPGLMAGLRWLAAGCVLALVELARGHRLPGRRSWPGLALIGALFIVGGNGLVVWAEQWVPSGLTAVLLASSPFWMVGIEAAIPGGERPPSLTWLGLAIGFTGIVVLVWPDLVGGGRLSPAFLAGVLGLQLACATWSAGSAYERRRRNEDEHTLGGAGLEMIFGGAMLTIVGTAAGEWPHVGFSARSATAFAYLVLIGSVVGYSAYIYTLKHLKVSTILAVLLHQPDHRRRARRRRRRRTVRPPKSRRVGRGPRRRGRRAGDRAERAAGRQRAGRDGGRTGSDAAGN